MNIRTRLCFEISRRLMQPPAKRTVDYGFYQDWRQTSLSRSWDAFSDSLVVGKDVLDFGCGDGQLAFFLSQEKRPRKVIGVDINHAAIDRAREILSQTPVPDGVNLDFYLGSTDGLPFPSESFDTLIAFDCLEHVMSPDANGVACFGQVDAVSLNGIRTKVHGGRIWKLSFRSLGLM